VPNALHFTERARRAAATAAIAAGGLALHLAIQRLAPPPLWRPSEALIGVTPFLPWSIWIYLLFFPFLVLAGALQPHDRWRRLMLAWTLASVASWALILLVPVTFTRPDPSTLDPLHAWVFARVYGVDSAHVTFPCLHAAITWVSWHAIRDRGRKLRAGLFVVAVAITLSTMTSRQHLITDNAAGIVIAWACARTVMPRRTGRVARPRQDDQVSESEAASGSRS
jgi:hypothetical protein